MKPTDSQAEKAEELAWLERQRRQFPGFRKYPNKKSGRSNNNPRKKRTQD